jgi:hypothetical protein
MKPFVAILALAIVCLSSAPAQNTALIPTARDFPANWRAQHEANVAWAPLSQYLWKI